MKKTIIFTIFLGIIFTFFIYKFVYHEPLNIVVLGDGIATGETAYGVKGYSFNDYLKDELEDKKKIEEYITEFANPEETSTTLLTKLSQNYNLESTNTSIQQAIASSKIITISLGMYELNTKENRKSKDITNYLTNMEKIIKLIRLYNDQDIYLIGLFASNKISLEKIKEINKELQKICNIYHIKYIDIEDITKNSTFFFQKDSFYLNYKGHKYIMEKIKRTL